MIKMKCTQEKVWNGNHNTFVFFATKVNGNTAVRAREKDELTIEAPPGYYTVGEFYQFELEKA